MSPLIHALLSLALGCAQTGAPAPFTPTAEELLGTGKRLFGEGTTPRAFRLADTQQTATGAVLHVYERPGGLEYGEVEVGQETVVFDPDTARK